MLNEASLTDVMEPVGAIFLSRTALKEKLFHSGGLMQWHSLSLGAINPCGVLGGGQRFASRYALGHAQALRATVGR